MIRLLDDTLVAFALIVSVGYAFASLGPKGLRARLWHACAAVALRAPKFPGAQALARRLEAAAAKNAAACGGCGSCDTASSAPSASTAPGAPTAPTDIRIPLSKIGRRK
jgi:hypothetical protein